MAKIGVVVLVLSLVLVLSIHSVLAEESFVQTAADHINKVASSVKDTVENLKTTVGEAVDDAKQSTETWTEWFHNIVA
jgi:cell shape-determining protein MreC